MHKGNNVQTAYVHNPLMVEGLQWWIINLQNCTLLMSACSFNFILSKQTSQVTSCSEELVASLADQWLYIHLFIRKDGIFLSSSSVNHTFSDRFPILHSIKKKLDLAVPMKKNNMCCVAAKNAIVFFLKDSEDSV